jgi:hypothetical protein
MEGFGQGVMRGADRLRGMLGDFTDSVGGMSIGGVGAGGMPVMVNVNFHGALPTEEQAYRTGQAAGKGVADGFSAQVNQRDIQLAVRMA